MKKAIKWAWVAWLLVPVLFSCATYSNKMAGYYQSINRADYKRADEILSGNSFLQHERNKLLFFMEKGKIYHLMGAYDSSNLYFNLADNFIENSKKTAGDAVAGNLLNPMMKTYQGEDYERFLIHYYKALNYFYTGATDEAVVEARRISLSTNAQQQKVSPTSNKYTEDAFALIVQGLIYEAAAQTNNAFISYRNAADLFLNTAGGGYYGVAMPQQLKKDLLKTTDQMGFGDQVSYYQQKFNTTSLATAETPASVSFFTTCRTNADETSFRIRSLRIAGASVLRSSISSAVCACPFIVTDAVVILYGSVTYAGTATRIVLNLFIAASLETFPYE